MFCGQLANMAILWSCDILVVAVVFVCLCDAQPWGPSSQKPAVARGQRCNVEVNVVWKQFVGILPPEPEV